jgi:hypothetical protein
MAALVAEAGGRRVQSLAVGAAERCRRFVPLPALLADGIDNQAEGTRHTRSGESDGVALELVLVVAGVLDRIAARLLDPGLGVRHQAVEAGAGSLHQTGGLTAELAGEVA